MKGNIKVDFKEMGHVDVDWLGLDQDRFSLGTYSNKPFGSIKSGTFLEHWTTVKFLGRF
jgi:hypothetical protein